MCYHLFPFIRFIVGVDKKGKNEKEEEEETNHLFDNNKKE